jgi:hypothetical protein
MSASELASLTLPGGRPLPPSMRRWLQFDRSVPFKGTPPPVRALGARDYWIAEFRAADPEWLGRLDAMLPGDLVALPGGDETRSALYLGATDEGGEYPVVVFDVDDVPSVFFEAGFDVWLARYYSLPDFTSSDPPPRVLFDAFGARPALTAW